MRSFLHPAYFVLAWLLHVFACLLLTLPSTEEFIYLDDPVGPDLYISFRDTTLHVPAEHIIDFDAPCETGCILRFPRRDDE